MNKITNLQRNHSGLGVRIVVGRPYARGSNPLTFECIFFPLKYSSKFFSFKIEETYTLTTFFDQKLSLSVYSESTYDSLVGLGFFDLSKLLKKNIRLSVI